jgi:hypothetical protein
LTQTSRSSRASRNTSAVARARSINSPFIFCSFSRRSCAFSTSFAVFACRKVVPAPTCGAASSCSRKVSATADTAVSGTGFIRGRPAPPRCFEGSVIAARRASDAAASIEPSVWSTRRPAAFAFWIAPRETPAGAA